MAKISLEKTVQQEERERAGQERERAGQEREKTSENQGLFSHLSLSSAPLAKLLFIPIIYAVTSLAPLDDALARRNKTKIDIVFDNIEKEYQKSGDPVSAFFRGSEFKVKDGDVKVRYKKGEMDIDIKGRNTDINIDDMPLADWLVGPTNYSNAKRTYLGLLIDKEEELNTACGLVKEVKNSSKKGLRIKLWDKGRLKYFSVRVPKFREAIREDEYIEYLYDLIDDILDEMKDLAREAKKEEGYLTIKYDDKGNVRSFAYQGKISCLGIIPQN